MKKFQKGLTFIELLVVLGIIMLLLGFAAVNVSNTQNKTSLNAAISTLVSDIRQQQLKAMVGDTEGRGTVDTYGIYFQSNQYTLFHGSAPTSSSLTIPLSQDLQFSSVNLPNGNTVIFQKGSGEVSGYSATQNSITLKNTNTNEQIVIYFNALGVISVN